MNGVKNFIAKIKQRKTSTTLPHLYVVYTSALIEHDSKQWVARGCREQEGGKGGSKLSECGKNAMF